MTDEKILEVLDGYQARLSNTDEEQLVHCREMIPKMRAFLTEGRREKVFRWLGFIQGVFWAYGWFTIEEMANHNRPTECCGKGPYNG